MRTAVYFLALVALAVAGCKKTDPFVNPVYQCNCGTITWDGTTYPLLMSEYVELSDDEPWSRRYYFTADIRTADEVEAHNLNIQIEVDSLITGSLFIPENNVKTLFEEVNENDELLPYRQYTAMQGVVNISPVFLAGDEEGDYQMIVKEVVNGAPVGFDISVAGDFVVTIE